MARDRMQFILELIDRASAPARRVSGALKDTRKWLFAARKEADTGRFMKSRWSALKDAGAGFGKFASGAKAAVSAIAKLGAVGLGVLTTAGGLAIAGAVWAADVIAFKDQSFSAMSAFLKSETAAKGIYDRTLAIAAYLRINGRDALEGVNQLLGAGIEAEKAMQLFQASLDLKALKGADPKALATILGQIKAKGKLQTEELLQLAESGGLGVDKVQEALGGLMGIDITAKSGMDKLTKALQGGAVDSATALDAVLIAIQKMTGKGLGQFAAAGRNSLGSIIEGFKSLPELLMLEADTSGLKPLLDWAGKLLDALNPTTDEGKRLIAMVSQLASEIGGSALTKLDPGKLVADLVELVGTVIKLSKAFGSGAFGTFFDMMKPLVDLFGKANGGAGAMEERMRMLGQAAGAVAGALMYVGLVIAAIVVGVYTLGKGVLAVVDWIAKQIALLPDTVAAVITWFKNLGTNIVNGIWAGIVGAWEGLKKGWNALIAQLPANVAEKLQIKSPSRVMEKLGVYTIQGFTKGIESNDNGASPANAIAQVAAAAPAAVATVAPSGARASAGGSGAIVINVNVQVVAAPGMSPSEASAIGEAAGNAAASQIADVLEDLRKQVAA